MLNSASDMPMFGLSTILRFFGNGAADVAGKLVQHVGQEFFVGVTRRQLNRLVFFAVADVEIGYDLATNGKTFPCFRR